MADINPERLSIKQLRRQDVVDAFHHAFEMIGGTPRLALWADANPTEFYKLYARLLPSAVSALLDGDNEVVIMHVLPRTTLDGSQAVRPRSALDGPPSHNSIYPSAGVHALPSEATEVGDHGVPPPSGEDSGGSE